MDLSDYVERVFACTDMRALKRLLVTTFEERGACAVSGYSFPFGGGVGGESKPLISTFPESVSEIYRATVLGEDPVMYAAMTLGAPVHFLKIEHSLLISAKARAVIEAMRAAGIRDAVATPVFAKPGAYGYFIAAFKEPQPDITVAEMRRIKFLFSEFFYRYRELVVRRRSTLSLRERQVLVAIVSDKSNTEIAAFLGVSESTVETYIKRCFTKLEVANRTQAALRYLGGASFDSPQG